jgi:hypothetical protein
VGSSSSLRKAAELAVQRVATLSIVDPPVSRTLFAAWSKERSFTPQGMPSSMPKRRPAGSSAKGYGEPHFSERREQHPLRVFEYSRITRLRGGRRRIRWPFVP